MSKICTTSPRFRLLNVEIIALSTALLISGCSTPNVRYGNQPARNPALVTGLDSLNQDSRLHQPSSSSIKALTVTTKHPPAVTPDPPPASVAELDQEKSIDRGAVAVIRSIANALVDRPPSGQPIVVSLVEIRNLSRGSPEEFHRFLDRLSGLLSDAGREIDMRFSTLRDEQADYRLTGAAYLITDRETELWELYLRLLPADETWTVWRTRRPLCILRHPRENHRQVFWKLPKR